MHKTRIQLKGKLNYRSISIYISRFLYFCIKKSPDMRTSFITDKKEIESIIDQCDICFIGIIEADGTPYVIPMNFGYLNNEIIANKEFNFTREGLNGNIIPNFLIQIKDSMFSHAKSFELQEQEVITKTLSNGGKIFSYKHSFSFDFLPKEGKFDYESFYKGFTAYNIIENTKISIDSYKERMEIFDSEIEKILKFEEEMELIYHQKIQSISPDFKTFIKLDI